jgi:hypothetical protein
MFQITSVSFVGVNVNFKFDPLSYPDEKVFECHRTEGVDFQLHTIFVFDTIMLRFLAAHVNMPFCSNDPFFEIDDPFRTDKNATGSILKLTAFADWWINSK